MDTTATATIPLPTADFVAYSARNAEQEVLESEGGKLCCCEYIDKDNQRFHILCCCCNCEDFDLVLTHWVTCRRVPSHNYRAMLLAFQDRLRIPWRGGAKQVSLDTVLPIVALPLVIAIAAINAYTAGVMFVSCGIFIGYAYRCVQQTFSRTRFFCMWLFWSIVYMAVLFELTMPLLELLPEENLILVLLTTAAIFSLWRAKQRAALAHVIQSSIAEDELPDITEASAAEEAAAEAAAAHTVLLLEDQNSLEDATVDVLCHQPNICATCRKYVPPRTVHCSICGACILRYDHHSYWLDCCIGSYNHRYYMSGLLLSALALLVAANLTLTAVCHPFLIVRVFGVPLMLTDDCSEVFEEYGLSVSFVIANYAILMALYILWILLRQTYTISRGLTLHEYQRGYDQCGNRKSCWTNWRAFLL